MSADHGNVVRTFDAMGRPPFPSREQIAALRVGARLSAPQALALRAGELRVTVPTHGLAVVEIH